MKPAFTALALSAAGLLTFAARPAAAAPRPLARPTAGPADTVVLRLPNKVLMTLVVRDAAQLRELKKYQLDSLTSRLATYIDKTEAAARAGSADKVTMTFNPDQDHPGQQLPAEVRITARKPAPGQATGTTKTEVDMRKKKFGLSADGDGTISYRFRNNKEREDSTRQWKDKRRHRDGGHIGLRYDFGVNTFVNNSSSSSGVPALRHGGSFLFGLGGTGYANIGFNYVQPLTHRGRARLAVTFGPEFTFHRFELTGNQQWAYANGVTSLENAPDVKQIDHSRLSVASLELPLMLRFRLLDAKKDNKTLSLGVGGFGGYRLGSSLETEYKLAGSELKREDEVKGQLGLRNWQYGVQGEIGFHALRVFARYNLNELFEDGKGPQTHAFAAGIRVFGF